MINTDGASTVTLTSAGGTETLVNDGVGAALAIKGLSAGAGIAVTATGDAITIRASVVSYSIGAVVSPSGVGASTATIAHNLNNDVVQVSVRENGALPKTGYAQGVDYLVIYESASNISLRDIGGNLAAASSLDVYITG